MPAPKGNKYAAGNQGGRPGEYDEEFHTAEVYELALLGATDDEIAEDFGISVRTLNRWKKKHKEFWQSLTRGKRRADARVATKMFERACGYEHAETKFFVVKRGKDNEEVIEKETVARYPPDTKAAAIWLSNRTRNWRERVEPSEKPGRNAGKPDMPQSITFTIIDPKTNESMELNIGGVSGEDDLSL